MCSMKEKKKWIIAITICVVVIASVATYFVMKYQTYDHIEITKTHKNNNKDNKFRGGYARELRINMPEGEYSYYVYSVLRLKDSINNL